MDSIIAGAQLALTWQSLLAVLAGVVVGQVLGAVPGLTATMTVALLIPYTYYLDPWVGVPMLIGMFKGSLFGSSVTAILIKTPGTPAAAATVMDGYPLAQQGKGEKACKMALYSSVFGDSFSDIVLIFGASFLAAIALNFGPAEYTLLVAFSLITMGFISGARIWKGIVAMGMGMLLGIIGLDPVTATPRMTMGFLELEEGIGLIPMLIGFLAVAEVLRQMEHPVEKLATSAVTFSEKREDRRVSWAEFRSVLPTLLKSSSLGTAVGALPGISATVAAFLAYNEARRTSKAPETFGKGALDGIAAPESANNAVSGANLIPMMAFGIPGDIAAALILSALLIQGITPGPVVFRDNPEPIYAVFTALLLANAINLVLGHGLVHMARRVVTVPKRILFPVVIVIAAAGAYAMRGSVFDVQLVFLFGLLGWGLTKLAFPTVPLLIGFILMPILESNLRISMLIAGSVPNPLGYFFARPAFIALLGAMALLLILVLRRLLRDRQAMRAADMAGG
ncbi:tripartite tricarboxylate transporter permease [Salipiger mucosus]|uniref:Tricarboxylate transport membrane protein TctA n=1 Tax=Salipiger mucosus DSM 16094 TaxID=1123237 RepID=S9QAK1_9RHOB|nr:tripartite tricarboxylate transporter permease [Salipiger mucosus]EPX76638.1 Tricarboxylate transport membrane protein TctA [Salipiger mucosus DSM 16094]